jgi:hypothetical protein
MLRGTVALQATASDSSGVFVMKWYVDGVEVAYDESGPPWVGSWNTTTVSNGQHRLFAKAFDGANWGTSTTVTIKVRN